MPEAAGAPRAGRRAELAIRRTWRLETAAAEVETATRILADMPLRQGVTTVQRLAAVGAELGHLRAYLERLGRRVEEGEAPLGGHREAALLEAVTERVGQLVGALEVHFGPFPALAPGSEERGMRETFLVEIAEERVDDCRWLLQCALEESEAEPPEELLGRAYLRAVGGDLDELEVYLGELAREEGQKELRQVVLETQRGCRAIVDAIAAGLPAMNAEEGS